MVDVIHLEPGSPRPDDPRAFYVQSDQSGRHAAITTYDGVNATQGHPVTGDPESAVRLAETMADRAGYPKVYVLPPPAPTDGY